MKTTFVALLLMVAGALAAQQKYEYASISFNSLMMNKNKLMVTDDKGCHSIQLTKEETENVFDMTPVFKELKKLEDEGWELFDSQISPNNGGHIASFLLRKKRG